MRACVGRYNAWRYTRQRTVATAVSYFWRFFLKHSFCDHEPTEIAVVCFSLASKVEENPVGHKHLVDDLAPRLRKCVYDIEEPMREERLLAMELVVLEELGFNLSVFDPYTPLQKFLKHPTETRRDWKNATLLVLAWGLLNDSLCTPLCVLLAPEEIAFAAIRVAVELSSSTDRGGDPPPESFPELRATSFEVNQDDVVLACREMLDHYKFPSSSSSPADNDAGGGGAGGGGGGGGGAGEGGPERIGGGRRQQHLAQHRHEVAAFLAACKET